MPHRDHMRRHQVPPGAEREEAMEGKTFHCGFFQKGQERQGKHGIS